MRLLTWFPLCAALLAQTPPDKIFVNAVVLTMDTAGRTAQAVAIHGEEIVSTRSTADIRKLAGTSTQIVDLGGKTLLPGFYAAHDHFPGAGTVAVHYVDLYSPPIGKMQSIAVIIVAACRYSFRMQYSCLVRVRTSITLPAELLKIIDRANSNRSAFFERAASAYLTGLNKAKRDASDLAIINSNADRLNAEALDVLDYQ